MLRTKRNDGGDPTNKSGNKKRRKVVGADVATEEITVANALPLSGDNAIPPAGSQSLLSGDGGDQKIPTSSKSRKELRNEKKAAKKAVAKIPSAKKENNVKDDKKPRIDKRVVRKEQRRDLRKEKKASALKAEEDRFERQRQLQREKQQGAATARPVKGAAKKKKETKQSSQKEDEMMSGVFSNLFQASGSGSEGFTTLERGVQYKDVRIGTGTLLMVRELAQVKYVLTAVSKQFSGTTIELERSKDFKFRLGRGEVIQGWDIGMVGMRQGGTRKLIIPPKAGYGSTDIGAGPGAILNFEITLLSC